MIRLIYFYYSAAYRYSDKYDMRGYPHLGAFWMTWFVLFCLNLIFLSNLLINVFFLNKGIIVSAFAIILPVIIIKLILKRMGKIPPDNFKVKFNFIFWFIEIVFHLFLIFCAVQYGIALLD